MKGSFIGLSTKALMNTTNTTLPRAHGQPDPSAPRSGLAERKRGY